MSWSFVVLYLACVCIHGSILFYDYLYLCDQFILYLVLSTCRYDTYATATHPSIKASEASTLNASEDYSMGRKDTTSKTNRAYEPAEEALTSLSASSAIEVHGVNSKWPSKETPKTGNEVWKPIYE